MPEDLGTLKKHIFELIAEYHKLKGGTAFVPGKTKVNYAGRVYDEKEMIAMVDAILDFWLTLGPRGDEFERGLANFLGCRNSMLTNSGSSANLVAVSALLAPQLKDRLRNGEEVIVPACSFPTTVNPIIQNNLTPVFVDSDIGTYNAIPEEIENAITPKTRAIVFAHTLGNPQDMDWIMEIAEKNDLFVIEDTCDGLGSKYGGKFLGTMGDMGTISFYPAHHITMGEGGAVVTSDPRLDFVSRSLRNWGRACWCKWNEKNPLGACRNRFGYSLDGMLYDHLYMYTNIGYNLKPTDVQAAMGIEQLKKLPDFINARKKNFNVLYKALGDYEEFLVLPESLPKAEPCWFAFPLTVKGDSWFGRHEITSFLEKNLIETRVLFAGNIVRQPAYREVKKTVVGGLKNSDEIMKNTFFIGIYPGIDNSRMSYVIEKIDEFFNDGRSKGSFRKSP